jgi:ribose/xylose/arabinose/galactoside ABC-type transport system permease subunit
MTPAQTTTLDRPALAPGLPFWRRLLLSEYLVLFLTVVYVLGMALLVPEILTPDTWRDILAAMIPLLIVAVGQMFVLVVAGIDLSATSVLAFASVLGAAVITMDGGPLMGMPAGIVLVVGLLAFMAVGGAVGAVTGDCTTRFNMPPFIVTLTTMMFFSGAAIWVTTLLTDDGSSIGSLPRAFVFLGQGRVLELPFSLLIALAVCVVAHVTLAHSLFGRWLFAIGINPNAAAVSGVPVRRAMFWAYVISGVCAGLAAVIYTARLETGTPVLGQRILLDVVGAAVIGGVSLFGGKAKVLWVVFGALFLTVVDKGLQLMGLSLAGVFAIKGGVILLAAVVDAQRQRLRGRS